MIKVNERTCHSVLSSLTSTVVAVIVTIGINAHINIINVRDHQFAILGPASLVGACTPSVMAILGLSPTTSALSVIINHGATLLAKAWL
jgi:hypothetical protein